MIYTQKQVYDYLLLNPLNVNVAVGDVSDLDGRDYLFLSYTNDEIIGADNKATYQTFIQITVATRDFEDRKTLVNYVKDLLNVTVTYEKAIDFEYYVARCNCGVLMYEESES